MAKKYFCWNIDDGLEQDKRVVEILRRYGMGATFNLNAGLFGAHHMTRWDNNRARADATMEEYRNADKSLTFVEHFRIPADEVVEVYRGFEIAAHCYRHEDMTSLTREEMAVSVQADKDALSRLFGQKITGFAYPYGRLNDTAVSVLREAGIVYARTTDATDSFAMPKDLLRLPMNGWQGDGDIFEKISRFAAFDSDEDTFFLLFAHGFEFDYDTPESNWYKLEKLCEHIARLPGLTLCSTGEALNY